MSRKWKEELEYKSRGEKNVDRCCRGQVARNPGEQLWGRKDKVRDSSLKPPDSTVLALAFTRRSSCWTSRLYNCNLLHLCRFKLLHVWQFDTVTMENKYILWLSIYTPRCRSNWKSEICAPNDKNKRSHYKHIHTCFVWESTGLHNCTMRNLYNEEFVSF